MIANEYAKAIFELATSNKKVSDINDSFSAFERLLKDNPDYLKVLTYPKITIKDKKDSLKKALKGFNSIFVDFLYVLLDNGRMDEFENISHEYNLLVQNSKNVIDVDVYSAKELNEEQIKNIQKGLSKNFDGKKVLINNIVDSNLIGGIKAVSNGKSIDVSLNNRLDNLKKSL